MSRRERPRWVQPTLPGVPTFTPAETPMYRRQDERTCHHCGWVPTPTGAKKCPACYRTALTLVEA